MLILGSGGVAAAAAAGVLLTATGAAGALVYVAWAAVDGGWVRWRAGLVRPPALAAPDPAATA